MKRTGRKLKLSRESLRSLQLRGVAGAIDIQDASISCPGYGGCSDIGPCNGLTDGACTDGCNTYRCSFFC